MLRHMKYALGILLSFSMVSESLAIGASFIGNEVPSARAAGAGYVGVAGQNNDPTAVFTNPGAMTSLKGTQATFGMHFENIRGSYKNDSGVETKAQMVNVAVPNLSATHSFMDGKWAAGLGVQSPYGLATHWGDNSPMRYVATNSHIEMVDIMPAVAYQVHPMVSVGVGADYVNLFSAELDRMVYTDGVNTTLGGTATGAGDVTSSLQGDADSWGYHAGIVIQPTEKHAIGITYHSKVNLRIEGTEKLSGMSGDMATLFGGDTFSTPAYTDIVLPQNVQFGYAFKPNDKWMFEADTAWYHWSESQDVNVRYPNIDATTLAGQTQLDVLNTSGAYNPIQLNLRDAWSFSVGTNYKASDKWQFRGGFWYEPWALPEVNFTPAIMDLTRYGISAGTGYALTENVTIDAAYTAVFFHNRTIHNNVHQDTSGIPEGSPLPSGTAESNGTYSDFANLLALNFTYRFGNSK